MSMWSELCGRNICLSHGASQSNLMCSFHAIFAVSQVDKKVTENANKNRQHHQKSMLSVSYVEGLEDTVVRQGNTV